MNLLIRIKYRVLEVLFDVVIANNHSIIPKVVRQQERVRVWGKGDNNLSGQRRMLPLVLNHRLVLARKRVRKRASNNLQRGVNHRSSLQMGVNHCSNLQEEVNHHSLHKDEDV